MLRVRLRKAQRRRPLREVTLMKALLLYPRSPDTFWSFRHALKFIGRKASFPPLGLLTVAAMLPPQWEKRLVDLNVRPLTAADLAWADIALVSAMAIQRSSALETIRRCREAGVRVVAGGPLFTSCHADFADVDHLVLGEAEVTLPPFLADLERGEARHLYLPERRADLTQTPVPLWDLAEVREYAAMNVQYSRGCPFDCEFCDITALFGRKPRTKSAEQVLEELETLRVRKWRGAVFFVDDNFIGDKGKLKREVLPAVTRWMTEHRHPFYFYTEASIDLADDAELLAAMVAAGFREVFIGIETPNDQSHHESGKVQNRHRDLLESVRRIQRAGLQVHAGFIVGFDSDPPSIFDRQIRFIQESGIATAMVGILTALRGTRLYRRLEGEGRLLGETTGNNTATSLNFVPQMPPETLVEGYVRVVGTLYSPRYYYRRVLRQLREYRPSGAPSFHLQRGYLAALCKSVVLLGVVGRERFQFWKLVLWSLARRPRLFPLAITYAVYGFHFRKISEAISATAGGRE